jgi:hypothetical protein
MAQLFHTLKGTCLMAEATVLLLIIIIKLILLKIRVRTVKFQIYEWQCATGSGAFRPNPAQRLHLTCAFCIYKK